MPKRPWTDAEFVVVSERRAPARWDPMRGLSALQRIVVLVFTGLVLWGLKLVIAPPIGAFVDWLFALGHVAGRHP